MNIHEMNLTEITNVGFQREAECRARFVSWKMSPCGRVGSEALTTLPPTRADMCVHCMCLWVLHHVGRNIKRLGGKEAKFAKGLNLRDLRKRSMTRRVILAGAAGAFDEDFVDLLRARADRAFWARGIGQVQTRLRGLGRRLGLGGHSGDSDVSKQEKVKQKNENA